MKTCFKRVDYDLQGLLHYIDIGDIALPDIQRPFVWANTKVRDLFDSMYRGFPVGYLLFWENGVANSARQIGIDEKSHRIPQRLIVDGQQRLTSLYSVFRGKKILDADYKERHIEIAFRPRDGKFEVADAAIRKDAEWIPNISEMWASGKSSRKLVNDFIDQLKVKSNLTDEDEELMAHNLDRLFDLHKYPFTALEISPSVDEEHVADIFVRINSEGIKLNQADFILTLLSVFWDEGRHALETFCRSARQAPDREASPSPFNHLIQPDPDQLLRVSIALGFNRGKLKNVYHILRGKDLDTGKFSDELREKQFAILQKSQEHVLNLTYWHQFLNALIGTGFRISELISSQNSLFYSYAFYLIGKIQYQVSEDMLQRLIARWFFSCSLTGRYTGSSETVMDGDLNHIKNSQDATGFCREIEQMMNSQLTNDYWEITLPASLESSAVRNPGHLAYIASQSKLGAPVLFSDKKVHELLDPAIKPKKKALERHHLFPRAWLENQGISDLTIINQNANMALIEWPENISINKMHPVEYVPRLRERFTPDAWSNMHEYHALPLGWENMNYIEFINERRKLMAAIIRKGFEAMG